MIYITEKAANKVKEIADNEGESSYIVRATVKSGGCSGFQNDIYFDDKINELDEVIEFDGIKIVVDQLSYQYLDEITIDFVAGQFESGFKFVGGQIKGSCGCGKSIEY